MDITKYLQWSLEVNVRENRRGNQEWTTQRHLQYWAYKTQYEGRA